jgi:hypothetical protein
MGLKRGDFNPRSTHSYTHTFGRSHREAGRVNVGGNEGRAGRVKEGGYEGGGDFCD